MYVAARDAGVVTAVQIPANTVVTTLAVPGGRIQNVAISRDGTQLFATDIQRSKLIVWDLTNENAPFQEVAIGSGSVRNAFDVAETPDGVQLFVSALADGNIYVLDRKPLSLVATLPVGALPYQLRMSPYGSTAYVEDQDSPAITYIDVATNQIIAHATIPPGSILNMGLSRDGTRLYALPDYDGVYVIDVNSRAVIA